MSKLLKKDGQFVKRNGKLVKADDPAKCPCCGPPPPPVKYICAIRSPCSELPLRAGRWGWIADGRWIPVDNGCARYPPFLCTMAPAPNRPGVVGETVNVGCVEVTPSTTKECITEEEFDKGGWIKVSGPHDTIQICEAACNPPPPPPPPPPDEKPCCFVCEKLRVKDEPCPPGYEPNYNGLYCYKKTEVDCEDVTFPNGEEYYRECERDGGIDPYGFLYQSPCSQVYTETDNPLP